MAAIYGKFILVSIRRQSFPSLLYAVFISKDFNEVLPSFYDVRI